MRTKDTLYKLLRIAIGNCDDLALPKEVSFLDIMDLSEAVGVNGLIVSGFQKLVDNGLRLTPTTKEEKKRLKTTNSHQESTKL